MTEIKNVTINKDEYKSLNVYVGSEYSDEGYKISVKIDGQFKDDKYHRFEEKLIFIANKKLTSMNCIKCSDNEFFEIAHEYAYNHMLELKHLKNDDSSIIGRIKNVFIGDGK